MEIYVLVFLAFFPPITVATIKRKHMKEVSDEV